MRTRQQEILGFFIQGFFTAVANLSAQAAATSYGAQQKEGLFLFLLAGSLPSFLSIGLAINYYHVPDGVEDSESKSKETKFQISCALAVVAISGGLAAGAVAPSRIGNMDASVFFAVLCGVSVASAGLVLLSSRCLPLFKRLLQNQNPDLKQRIPIDTTPLIL